MKRIFTSAVMVLGLTFIMNAQTAIRNEKMSQDGINVTVEFDVDTDDTNLPKNRKEVILPYIYNGKDTLFFDVVEVYGKGRFKRERQVNAINGEKDWELTQGQILKNEGIYNYQSKVPLKRWMKSATLGIRRQIIGCACEEEMGDEDLAYASLFEEPEVQRRIPKYNLPDVTKSWDFGYEPLDIIFKVSKIEIDSTVFDNEVTFGKILAAVDNIKNNPKFSLDKIEVAGYASPEGPQDFNTWLGENRAKALIDYIIAQRPQYNLTVDDFKTVNGEENWTGLRQVVEKSDLKFKDEVLLIIDNADLSNELKKMRIEALDKGWTWKRMKTEYYPYLRSARYLAVYYDTADENIADVINAANQMIRDGKYQEAFDHVSEVKDDIRAFNTIGVSLMMQAKFEEAMPWFQKALENGCHSAQNNIDAVNAEYQWEEQRRKEIEEYLKKYE